MPICRWTWTSTRRSRSSTLERLEQRLLLGDRELEVAGDEVGEPAGLGDGVEHLVDDLLGQAAPLAELGGALAESPCGARRTPGRSRSSGFISSTGMHDGAEVALGRRVLERGRALLALEQELDAAQPALDLADPRDDAHRVEDVGRRLVGVVALGDGEDEPVALERRLDRAKRARPARRDRRGEAGEDDRSAQRENRECLACCHLISRRKKIELDVLWTRAAHTPFQLTRKESKLCAYGD